MSPSHVGTYFITEYTTSCRRIKFAHHTNNCLIRPNRTIFQESVEEKMRISVRRHSKTSSDAGSHTQAFLLLCAKHLPPRVYVLGEFHPLILLSLDLCALVFSVGILTAWPGRLTSSEHEEENTRSTLPCSRDIGFKGGNYLFHLVQSLV